MSDEYEDNTVDCGFHPFDKEGAKRPERVNCTMRLPEVREDPPEPPKKTKPGNK